MIYLCYDVENEHYEGIKALQNISTDLFTPGFFRTMSDYELEDLTDFARQVEICIKLTEKVGYVFYSDVDVYEGKGHIDYIADMRFYFDFKKDKKYLVIGTFIDLVLNFKTVLNQVIKERGLYFD
jgi:hypothetical protein